MFELSQIALNDGASEILGEARRQVAYNLFVQQDPHAI